MSYHLAEKWCFHGQHTRPVAEFRPVPGLIHKREVCAECYRKIMASRAAKGPEIIR